MAVIVTGGAALVLPLDWSSGLAACVVGWVWPELDTGEACDGAAVGGCPGRSEEGVAPAPVCGWGPPGWGPLK